MDPALDLEVQGLHVARDNGPVLRGVDLRVPAGELAVVLGASGSGKSTLLRAIAGLEPVSAGHVLLGGEDVTDLPPGRRGASMVFQGSPLHPRRDVRANLALPLELHGIRGAEIDHRVGAEARAFSLWEFLHRLPGQLSTGQRQATATARSLVRAPRLLLLDEPLSDLDDRTRSAAVRQLALVQEGYGVTTVLASNDQRHAATLASSVAVLDAGRVVQAGTWTELLERPADTAVAGFLGEPPMNLLPVRVERSGQRVALVHGRLRRSTWDTRIEVGRPGLTLGIRPEHLEIVPEDDSDVVGRAGLVQLLGPDGVVHLDIGGDRELVARVPRPLPRRGSRLALRASRSLLFDANGTLIGDVR